MANGGHMATALTSLPQRRRLFRRAPIQGFVVGTPMLRSTDWPTGEPRELPRILAVTSGMILTPRDPLPS
jgi:hypothetical protein